MTTRCVLRARRRRAVVLGLGAGALAAALPRAPHAQLPPGPVTIVVSFAPGGASDSGARILARQLAVQLGVQVDVVNRPNATADATVEGVLAAEAVVKSPPDGRTLLLGTAATIALAPVQNRALPYEPAIEFAPVALVAATPFIVAVHPSVPAQNVAQFVSWLRAMGERVRVGSGGGTAHFAVSEFARLTGTKYRHERYASNGPNLLADLVSGEIDAAFDNLVLPAVLAGRVRALAVTTQTPLPALPHVPTLSESGVPGYDVGSWLALFARAGTPKATVDQLSREVAAALAVPDVRRELQSRGFVVRASNPEQLALFVREERARFARTAGTP